MDVKDESSFSGEMTLSFVETLSLQPNFSLAAFTGVNSAISPDVSLKSGHMNFINNHTPSHTRNGRNAIEGQLQKKLRVANSRILRGLSFFLWQSREKEQSYGLGACPMMGCGHEQLLYSFLNVRVVQWNSVSSFVRLRSNEQLARFLECSGLIAGKLHLTNFDSLAVHSCILYQSKINKEQERSSMQKLTIGCVKLINCLI
ncbi:hypothetical protein AVEN_87908-1 [Araneus ventricosus]|uniref:Uncharacterized protein n=1 Tax=Araneus ventricosus TaxID=182803 RepID=A0A4Y2BC20_ARAVE|nr:hypothetical protein AVEN_87908-1 [Araneus ventricosus]